MQKFEYLENERSFGKIKSIFYKCFLLVKYRKIAGKSFKMLGSSIAMIEEITQMSKIFIQIINEKLNKNNVSTTV